MTFISKIIRLNNNVLKACCDNFCESHECIALYSKFDISLLLGPLLMKLEILCLITFLVTL